MTPTLQWLQISSRRRKPQRNNSTIRLRKRRTPRENCWQPVGRKRPSWKEATRRAAFMTSTKVWEIVTRKSRGRLFRIRGRRTLKFKSMRTVTLSSIWPTKALNPRILTLLRSRLLTRREMRIYSRPKSASRLERGRRMSLSTRVLLALILP